MKFRPWAYWAFAALIPVSLAGPVQQSTCVTECRAPLEPKFGYLPGQSYIYNFQATTTTTVTGTTEDQAVLGVKGQATISFRAPCDGILTLSQTSITWLQGRLDSSELERRSIAFAFQDGVIEAVCASEEEIPWVLNVKKAVLSMLQHTAPSLASNENLLIENDIVGRCPTNYTSEGSLSGTATITKTKNPNTCSERIGRHSAIPSVPYSVPAELQTLPLLDSSSFCIVKIRNSLIASSNCKESHLFRPFSSPQGGGLRTEVTSELTFRNAAPSRPMAIGSNLVRSNMLYDPKGAFMEGENEKAGIANLMQQVCTQLSAGQIDAIPHLFNQLVYAIRQANANELKAVFYQVKNAQCKEASKREKIFLDALPMAGSPAAISLMADLLLNNQITERQALGWYTSLPLAKFPSSDAVKALLPILDKNPIALATLSISALAKRYCAQPNSQCQADANIQQLVSKLAQNLGNRCKVAKPEDERKVLAALKALGNVGILPNNVYSTVESCITETSLPIATRLAALDALRNNPCLPQGQAKLVSLLRNQDEDVEVRIGAYKILVLCPSGELLEAIQDILSKETSNQVGSFISTHLDNLKANTNPGKQAVHELVQSFSSNYTFPDDRRKFSRNYNLNHFCNVNNLGIDVDADLIFSPKSFSPRSLSLNLTLDIFGQSVNLFEIGGRVEGVESWLEKLMGPEGLWATQGGDSEGVAYKLFEGLNSLRSKRAAPTKQELATFNKLPLLQGPTGDLIRVDGFLRVFGSELGLLTFRGQDPNEIVNPIMALVQRVMGGGAGGEVDVARSLMFLDTSVSFPTVAGFPLKLAVNGTTSISLAVNRASDGKSSKLTFAPGAATQISAAMSIEGGVARTGMKLVTIAHTSVAVLVDVKVQPNLEIKVNLPREKLTLFELKSELLLVNQKALEGERSRKVLVKNDGRYVRGSCSDNLTPLFGLKTCAKYILQIPTPLQGAQAANDATPTFPLSGHGILSIAIEKDDTAIQGYTLSLTSQQQGPKQTLNLDYDVIGSKQNRRLSFKGAMTSSNGLWRVEMNDLTSPWTKMKLEGEVQTGADGGKVLLRVERDGREYYGRVQFDRKVEGKKITYVPVIEYGSPQTPRSAILDAKLVLQDNKIDWVFKTAGSLSKYPLALEGGVDYKIGADTKIAFKDVKVTSPIGKAAASGHLSREGRKYSTAVDLKYGAANHAVTLAAQFEDLSALDGKKFKTAINYKSTRFPITNVNLKWDYQRTGELLENNLLLIHGAPSEAAKNKLAVVQSSLYKGDVSSTLKVANKLEVTYPASQLNLKFDQTFNLDAKKATGNLALDFGTSRLLTGELNVDIKTDSPNALTGLFRDTKFKYDGTAKISYPGRVLIIKETLEKAGIKYEVKGSLEAQPGDKYEYIFKGTLDHAKEHIHDIQGEIKFKSPISPIKVRHTLASKPGVSYKTENKIEWSNQPQIVVDMSVDEQSGVSAALKVFYAGRVDAQLSGKLAEKERKADVSVNLLRLQRHIKTAVTIKPDGESTKWDANIAWDFSKDPKLRLGSEGSLKIPSKETGFELKSNWDILTQKYALSAKAKLDNQFAGEHSADWELVYPTGKKATVSWKAENKWTAVKIGHKGTLDAKLSSGDVYSLSVESKLSDLDSAKGTYTAKADINLKTPQWKDVAFFAESKRSYPSGKRLTENKLSVKIPTLGPNLDWSLKEELGKDYFKSSTQYVRGPSSWSADTSTKWSFVKSKVNLEAALDIKAPQTSLQNLKIVWTSATDTANNNFDMKEKLTVNYKTSQNIVLEVKSKLAAPLLDVSASLDTPYDGYKQQSVTFSGKLDTKVPVLQSSLHLLWTPANQKTKKESRVDVKVEKKGKNLDANFAVLTPVAGYETISLTLNGKTSSDDKRIEFVVNGNLGSSKSKLNGFYDRTPTSRDLDVTLQLPTGSPMRLIFKGSAQAPIYAVETKADWGRGTLNFKFNSKYQSQDNFEATVYLDSAALGISEYEILATNKIAGAERKLETTVKSKKSVLTSVKASYTKKESKTGFEIKGSADVVLTEPKLKGGIKFAEEKKGTEYRIDLEPTGELVGPVGTKVSLVLKYPDNEKSVLLSACSKDGNCDEYVFSHTKIAGRESGFDTIVHQKTIKGKVEALTGIRVRLLAGQTKLEHSLDISVASKVLGYKVYGSEQNYGLEVKTPSRTAATTVEISQKAGRSGKAQTQTVITVWLDKVRQADKKLVLVLSLQPAKENNLEGFALDASLKHPALTRSLDFSLDYLEGSVLRQVKIEADAFSAQHGKWTLFGTLRTEPVGKSLRYVSDLEIKSQGKNLAVLLHRESLSAEDRIQRVSTLKFLDAGNVDKELFVKFDVSQNHVDVAVGSPQRQLAFNGKWKTSSLLGFPRVEASGSTTILSLAPTSYKLDMSLFPKADLRVFYKATPENYYQLVGGLLNDRLFEVGLTRLVGANRNSLATLSLGLDDTEYLKTRVAWNIEQLKTLLEVAQRRGQLVREEVGVTLKALSTDVGAHLAKWNSFEKLGPEAQKLVTDYIQQIDALKTELAREESVQAVVKAGGALTANFAGTIEAISDIGDKLEAFISAFIKSVGAVTERVTVYLTNAASVLPQTIGKLAADTIESVVAISLKAYNVVLAALETPINYAKQYVTDALARAGLLEAVKSADQGVASLRNWVRTQVQEVIAWLQSWTKTGNVSGSFQGVQDLLKKIQNFDLRQSLIAILEDSVFKPIDEWKASVIQSYPEFTRPLNRWEQRTIGEVKLFLRRKPATVPNVPASTLVKPWYVRWREEFGSLFDDVFALDIEGGEVVSLIPLPVKVHSLRQLGAPGTLLPHLRANPTERYSEIEDLLYQSKARWDPVLIPARWRGHALLVGSQGYYTFDGKFYDFVSNCQYLLARDFRDGNFTVAINYEDATREPPRKTIVITDSTDVVEIGDNYKVTVNGKATSLPAVLNRLAISREWTSITVRRGKGLTVSCNIPLDICSFEVSPFYFGKTAGLLGTFNNEENDDFLTSTGKKAASVEEFASSWKINGKCKEKAQILPSVTTFDTQTLACEALLDGDNSALRPCFGVVSTSPFMNHCFKAVSKAKKPDARKAAICSIGGAYATVCRAKGVPVAVPASCSVCKQEEKGVDFDFTASDKGDIPAPSKNDKADVVLVVEQDSCNQDLIKENFASLIGEIESESKAKGLSSVNFGLIGYGGPKLTHAEVYTTAKDDVVYDKKTKITDVGKAAKAVDTLEAIEKATGYPFRLGAAKSIVLLSCSACNKKSQVNYDTLREDLLELDIALHVLTAEDIKLRGAKNKKLESQVIGYDALTSYNMNSAKKKNQLDGDEAARKPVAPVDDVCVNLAQEVGGSVFTSARLAGLNKPAQKKPFYTVMARRVAEKAARSVASCRSCACVPRNALYVQSLCKPCETPEPLTIYKDYEALNFD